MWSVQPEGLVRTVSALLLVFLGCPDATWAPYGKLLGCVVESDVHSGPSKGGAFNAGGKLYDPLQGFEVAKFYGCIGQMIVV